MTAAKRASGQQGRIPRVGLGPLPTGPGEVAHVARIDHRHRQPGHGQRRGDGLLEPTGRLQHDQGGWGRAQLGDQRGDAVLVVGERPDDRGSGLGRLRIAGGRGDIEPGLGHVDPDDEWGRGQGEQGEGDGRGHGTPPKGGRRRTQRPQWDPTL